MAKEKQIGKITHYFGKIGVGVLELSKKLKQEKQLELLVVTEILLKKLIQCKLSTKILRWQKKEKQLV